MAVLAHRPPMAATPGAELVPKPRLLKAAYLADHENLLRETRATALFYFPGPILLLAIFLALDYEVYVGTKKTGYDANAFTSGIHTVSGWFPSGHNYLLDGVLLLTILVALWLVIRYLRWISTVYGVTTNRVIIQSGILRREFDEIPIPQVRGVDVKQSVGQRILRYGSVMVSSESGRGVGNEYWHGIPRPFEFQRIIESATQRLMRAPTDPNWS